ncbi:MAG: septal ring lytic transglycosylase RlpA family protein [Rhodospirillales bacterium]|nr:septal ring lytic transglycosylase RlpA family protein [Rhodospirillales bacterium]
MTGLFLVGCSETQLAVHSAKRLIASPESEAGGEYKIGKPYQIAGAWYYPQEDFEYDESGIASWYGAKFHGRRTANSEVYDMNALTAAHRTLPMPSFVRVTNLENGRSLILRVNDRGPFARGRIIDISRRGAQLLDFQRKGTARVRVQVLADQTRALKARITNQTQLARAGSPITIDRLPKPKVQTQSLSPVGAQPTTAQALDATPRSLPEIQTAQAAEPMTLVEEPLVEDPLVSEAVEQAAVVNTNIFVQAGAFSRFDNANRVKAKLSPLGSVSLSQVLVNGRDLYRVRLGPIESVSAADRLLEAVAEAGYPEARIVVIK